MKETETMTAKKGFGGPSVSPPEALRKAVPREGLCYEHVYQLENNDRQLAIAVHKNNNHYHVVLMTDIPGEMILHWGVVPQSGHGWMLPPPSLHPAGTTVFQNKAARTLFVDHEGLRQVCLGINAQEAPKKILFVLNQIDADRWLNDHGSNFSIPLVIPAEYGASLGDPELAGLADTIIEKEMSRNSWTLMHRFNLCYDLLDKIGNNRVEGLALIFVWLRFSAIRQLDWQRNYNTKPRELAHALDRLTHKLADRYSDKPGDREFIRLILTTLGRGADGQQVRDEILRIMHRHHIKEVAGHFMEEWHQKLHNNTTPDDVVICEAYLEFLKSKGDLNRFYKKLQQGGVTKKRLKSYDRPIMTPPDFIPHLREALMSDFKRFLKILKKVHSVTDLGTAIEAAAPLFDARVRCLVDFIRSHRNDKETSTITLVEKITEVRRSLPGLFTEQRTNLRDLLLLDLALENFMRIAVERGLHVRVDPDVLVKLVALALENVCLSHPNDELGNCLRHWKRLKETPSLAREWSIHAAAALDRLGRALSNVIDRHYKIFQPKAEFLGNAFHAESWAVSLFSEEVVRGRPLFALAILLRDLIPRLRKSAGLGNWQVISRNHGIGHVEVVEELASIQDKQFDSPTIIIADKVAGNENIPEGATAVITPDVIDIVSHVAIRARNAHVLFATCYDAEMVGRLKSFRGDAFKLSVDAAGEVIIEKSPEKMEATVERRPPIAGPIVRPSFTAYAVSARDFNGENVGGKSNNLQRINGKLPDWLNLPRSVALPFGVFEQVLSHESNKGHMHRYEELTRRIDKATQNACTDLLAEIRATVLALNEPDELTASLDSVMEQAGLPRPANRDEAWRCIKQVWSSIWNDRAYLSRRTGGMRHDDLFMAVLIQNVVEAEYSFVIHTVNPFTENRDEVYAEVVAGLGETLVGNYPGRALSFTCKKKGGEPRLLAFPSKSVGLFGSGLIFRSDSSGEDLPGYAGAGIYESIMLPQARAVLLDYTDERLVWDADFRQHLLITIAGIGAIIEKILGSPQDIEGAYFRGRYYVVQTRPQVGITSDNPEHRGW